MGTFDDQLWGFSLIAITVGEPLIGGFRYLEPAGPGRGGPEHKAQGEVWRVLNLRFGVGVAVASRSPERAVMVSMAPESESRW